MWIAVQQLGSAAGIVTAAGSISSLAVGLFCGILVDRWNPRFTMITVDIVRALTVISLPLFFFFGGLQIWQLIAVTVIVETLDMLFDPSMQVSLPILIKDMHLLHATNALMDASRRISRILGPGLAGIFLLFLPIIHFFTIDAVSFFISAGAIFVVGPRFVREPKSTISKRRRQESFVAEMHSGFDLVRKSRPLVWALIALGVGNLAWGTRWAYG